MSEPDDPGGLRRYEVVVSDEQTLPADADAVRAVAEHALATLGVADGAELSVLLTTPERMRELKREHLGIDEATDVLAFPMDGLDSGEGPYVLGDVVLCPAVASTQAVEAGRAVLDEMNLLLVHGILHLLGHDHAEPQEKARMWAEQDRILAAVSR